MDSLREEKVKKFEEFVDLRLKPDLVHAIAERYNEVIFFCFSIFLFIFIWTDVSLHYVWKN